MKKVKVYQGDAFEFHTTVIKSKHIRSTDPDYKNRITSLNPTIKELYDEYNLKFSFDELTSLTAKITIESEKNDLRYLYNYNTRPFQELNNILTTGADNTRQPLCPNCTVNNVNTFDHLIPQSEFAEYVILPTNLMPCCSYCNGKKSINWRTGNMRRYLNLYIDDLPNIQYLFANLTLIDSTIKVNFLVENRNNIDIALFSKIENHYKDLELCNLFSKNCDNTISELKTELNKYKAHLSKDVLKQTNIDIEHENLNRYGFNYWKSILKIECVLNNDILDFLLNQ